MKYTKRVCYRLIVMFVLMLMYFGTLAQTVTVQPLWSNGSATTYGIYEGNMPSRFGNTTKNNYTNNLYIDNTSTPMLSIYVAKPIGTVEYYKDVQKIINKYIKSNDGIHEFGELDGYIHMNIIISDFVRKYNYPKEILLKDTYSKYGFDFIFNNNLNRIY